VSADLVWSLVVVIAVTKAYLDGVRLFVAGNRQ
jgi:hypothetical protein